MESLNSSSTLSPISQSHCKSIQNKFINNQNSLKKSILLQQKNLQIQIQQLHDNIKLSKSRKSDKENIANVIKATSACKYDCNTNYNLVLKCNNNVNCIEQNIVHAGQNLLKVKLQQVQEVKQALSQQLIQIEGIKVNQKKIMAAKIIKYEKACQQQIIMAEQQMKIKIQDFRNQLKEKIEIEKKLCDQEIQRQIKVLQQNCNYQNNNQQQSDNIEEQETNQSNSSISSDFNYINNNMLKNRQKKNANQNQYHSVNVSRNASPNKQQQKRNSIQLDSSDDDQYEFSDYINKYRQFKHKYQKNEKKR